MTSFACTQSESAPSRLDAHDLRAAVDERVAGHRDRDLEPARADREDAEPARRGRVRVGAEEQRAGPREALQVHVVRDPVAGPRVEQTESFAKGLR